MNSGPVVSTYSPFITLSINYFINLSMGLSIELIIDLSIDLSIELSIDLSIEHGLFQLLDKTDPNVGRLTFYADVRLIGC